MKRRLGIDYDYLFHILPDCYLVLANNPPDFTVIDVSDALLGIGNFTREDFLEKPLIEAYPAAPGKDNKEGHEELLASLRTCIETGLPQELGVIRYDVRSAETNEFMVRYWKTVNYPIFNDNVVSGVLLTTKDITEEILAEERLRAIAERRNEDIPAGVIGSWRYITEKDMVVSDKSTAHIFGISESQAIKGMPLQKFIDFIHEDDKDRVISQINKSSHEDLAYESEYRIVAANGDVKWVMARGQIGQEGSELVGILIDITERKNVSLEVQENEKRLRFMADTMPQMVWVAKPDGYHEYFNKRWYDYTGESDGDSYGDAWKRVVHPDDLEYAKTLWEESVKTGEDYDIEYRIREGKTGEYRWFAGRATAYKNKKGDILKWYGTCTDIQDQKNQEAFLEERVVERTRQLEESNKELENFAYVASHDLQEPLRKIQAFGNLLVDEYGDALGDGSLYLDRMKAAASRMSLLIEDLLAFSRVTTKQRPVTNVDLDETLREVLDDLDDRIRRTHGTVNITGTLPVIDIDPTHARQLFQNLISNALKFHKPDTPPVVDIQCKEDNEACIFTVADNGIGFEQKYADKIFAVFQRLHGKDAYDGTGIGLAICRKIAERYNGSLEAHGVPDKGATFTLRLPKTVTQKESI